VVEESTRRRAASVHPPCELGEGDAFTPHGLTELLHEDPLEETLVHLLESADLLEQRIKTGS